MVKTINLRGHHIEALAERYARQRRFPIEESPNNPSTYESSSIQIPGKLKKYIQDQNSYQNNSLQEIDDIFGIKRKHQILDALIDQWVSNPELQVRIVFGIDSICSTCPLLSEGCKAEGKDTKQEGVPLQEYGIDSSRTYTMRELIEIIKTYFTRTGFPSPRTRNGFGRSY